jgi:hypothetical protein
MLILIDSAIGVELSRLTADHRFRECIDNLSIAHRKGTHIVSGAPSVIRALVKAFDTNLECSGVLRSIAAHYHEQASLIAEVTDYILVQSREDSLVHRTSIAGRAVYSVSFVYFARFSAIQSSYLIAEDSTDIDIYTKVLQAYVHVRAADLRMLRHSVHGIAGGGSSTEDQFRERAREAPAFAIVDSDRQHPTGANGPTATSVLRAARSERDTTVSDVKILDSHELENMIPPALVRDCIATHDAPAFSSRVQKICDTLLDGSDSVRYIDLKNGIRKWDTLNKSDAETCQYYQRQAEKLPLALACYMPTCATRESCKCVHIDGLGDGFLARVAAKLTGLTPQKVSEYLFNSGSPTRELWLNTSKRLFSWACAARPLRA